MSDETDDRAAELLATMKQAWISDAHFFSDAGKEERERWVVQSFLTILTLTFTAEEIKSLEQSSKVDVVYRDARFQIKEIVNPNTRRTLETKTIARQVAAAQTLEQTVGPGFIYDTPPVTDGYELVRDEAARLAVDTRYSTIKGEIDLLFYVTRTRASLVRTTEHSEAELSAIGWRSVSCLMGDHAVVLFAQPEAPSFLREAINT